MEAERMRLRFRGQETAVRLASKELRVESSPQAAAMSKPRESRIVVRRPLDLRSAWKRSMEARGLGARGSGDGVERDQVHPAGDPGEDPHELPACRGVSLIRRSRMYSNETRRCRPSGARGAGPGFSKGIHVLHGHQAPPLLLKGRVQAHCEVTARSFENVPSAGRRPTVETVMRAGLSPYPQGAQRISRLRRTLSRLSRALPCPCTRCSSRAAVPAAPVLLENLAGRGSRGSLLAGHAEDDSPSCSRPARTGTAVPGRRPE